MRTEPEREEWKNKIMYRRLNSTVHHEVNARKLVRIRTAVDGARLASAPYLDASHDESAPWMIMSIINNQ